MRRTIKPTNRQAEYNPTKRRAQLLRETLARLQPTLEMRTAQTAVTERRRGFQHHRLQINDRSFIAPGARVISQPTSAPKATSSTINQQFSF